MQIRRIIEARTKAIAKLIEAGMAPDEAARVADERMTRAPEAWIRRPQGEFVAAIVAGETLTTGGISDSMKDRIDRVHKQQKAAAAARKALVGLPDNAPGWAS